MKFLNTLLTLLLVIISSCTITQEYTFNKDFSGSTKISIDMESFMEMMGGMDSTGNSAKEMKDSLNFVFEESKNKLDSIGMKNIKYGNTSASCSGFWFRKWW